MMQSNQQEVDYRRLCDEVLFKLQPPESLTQDLLQHNAGIWYQKPPYGQKINENTPWFWNWNHYVALQMSFPKIPIEKIREWVKTCKEHKIKTCKEHKNVEKP